MEDHLPPVFQRFIQLKEKIYDLYRDEKALTPERAQQMIAFYDDFYATITDDPNLMKRLREPDDEQDRVLGERQKPIRMQVAALAPMLTRRIGELEATLLRDPLDRTKSNNLLRHLCDYVAVDYTTGYLNISCIEHPISLDRELGRL